MIETNPARKTSLALLITLVAACSGPAATDPADLLLVNAHVYTFSWDEPDGEGRPAANAPRC